MRLPLFLATGSETGYSRLRHVKYACFQECEHLKNFWKILSYAETMLFLCVVVKSWYITNIRLNVSFYFKWEATRDSFRSPVSLVLSGASTASDVGSDTRSVKLRCHMPLLWPWLPPKQNKQTCNKAEKLLYYINVAVTRWPVVSSLRPFVCLTSFKLP